MKIQVSFDMLDLEKALSLAQEMEPYIDIIEIGSLLTYRYGESAIKRFRETFPQKTLLADMKIVDRGKEAARIGCNAGADWVTVLAGTGRNVIHAVCNAAHDLGKKVMLDLIDSSSLGQAALEAQNLGVDALLFHRPADETSQAISLEQWEIVRGNTKLPIFISAPVTREKLHHLLSLHPSGIVISKNIVDKDLTLEEIQQLSTIIRSA